jgi:hypothetical protein
MPSGENSISTRFSSDYQPKTSGRHKGIKNRSTVAKEILAMLAVLPDATLEKLKVLLPDLDSRFTAEHVLTLSVLAKAIEKGDGYLYAQIMDSAYGKPKQDVELSGGLKIGKDLADESYT